MEEMKNFGSWLHNKRRALDLTRQALAGQVGCAEITLRRIENGTLKPSKELASILLEKLGIPEIDREQWIQFARGLSEHPQQSSTPVRITPPTNLPSLLTTFIGREQEQTDILQRLDKHRLVTLTGAGGIGKTRLSINVGEQALNNYPHGVWLVQLDTLNDPSLLVQTISVQLGLTTQSNDPLVQVLINFLHLKASLLILDNCEHILNACAQLADTLLKHCPDLKILATSREALGIVGEIIYRVPSLRSPDENETFDHIRNYEAVRLFEERAQLAQANFALTSKNASLVVQICSRLDGIPLAIELTAARVDILTVEQITERLNDSFSLLTGGSRIALPRQQTIRASIDWSWALLTDTEQTLLSRLSVFSGGWTLDAAETICSGNGIESHQILECIGQLTAKSLINVDQDSERERRFRMHETIRQYANEKLVHSGETDATLKLHLKYFLELASLDESALHGVRQMEWFSRIYDERGNIRVALEHAYKTDLESGLYLAGRLINYWDVFDLREGLSWTTRFVQRSESENFPGARTIALLAQGEILWYLQQFEDALSTAEESLALSRVYGNRQSEFESLMLMGSVVQFIQGMDKKTALTQQALAMAISMGDQERRARALSSLGWDQRDPVQARAYWEDAVSLFRQIGDQRSLVYTLGILGFTVLSNGDLESGQRFLDEAVEANRLTNDKWGMEFVLTGLSLLALLRGEYEQARALLQENADFLEEVGNRMGSIWARARFGYIALREGKPLEAYRIFTEVMGDFQKDRNKSGLAHVIDKMASLFIISGKFKEAAGLIGWSDATREQIGDPRPRLEQQDVDKVLAACLNHLGHTARTDAYNAGRTMSLDEACALALEEIRL